MRRDDDLLRLRHMLDAAEDALRFAEGRVRADLTQDRMLLLSLVKSIEIVGEAASRISPATRGELPAVPWPDIIGMRNRLIHAYYDVDHDRVWETISDDLPSLIEQLREFLSASDG